MKKSPGKRFSYYSVPERGFAREYRLHGLCKECYGWMLLEFTVTMVHKEGFVVSGVIDLFHIAVENMDQLTYMYAPHQSLAW